MERKRIAVTGAGGQLGRDLCPLLAQSGYDPIGWDRTDLDITDAQAVMRKMEELRPDAVVHAAAYTKVDQAEEDAEAAYTVNAIGTRNVALAAEAVGAKLVYISTDYVFPGTGRDPWHESRETEPLNVYGHSKRAGEWIVSSVHTRWFVARTSWVYGSHGHNFVKTMLRLAGEKDLLEVVNDQVGCPTYTVDLSQAIIRLLESDKYGIYHVSNSGHCSWYEFAKRLFELAGVAVQVDPVTSERYPRPAKRPAYSVFEHRALRANGFPPMRPWEEALSEFVTHYSNKERRGG